MCCALSYDVQEVRCVKGVFDLGGFTGAQPTLSQGARVYSCAKMRKQATGDVWGRRGCVLQGHSELRVGVKITLS